MICGFTNPTNVEGTPGFDALATPMLNAFNDATAEIEDYESAISRIAPRMKGMSSSLSVTPMSFSCMSRRSLCIFLVCNLAIRLMSFLLHSPRKLWYFLNCFALRIMTSRFLITMVVTRNRMLAGEGIAGETIDESETGARSSLYRFSSSFVSERRSHSFASVSRINSWSSRGSKASSARPDFCAHITNWYSSSLSMHINVAASVPRCWALERSMNPWRD